MDEDIVGKGFHKAKLKIIAVIIVAVISASAFNISASYRELELFDQGYEYYLSYRPEKAVEAFTIFIGEFPRSPARDAAMFWLGKSLLQLKLPDDAKNAFRDIKSKFPKSPLTKYVDKELEKLEKEGEMTVAAPAITKGEEKHEPPIVETPSDKVIDANMAKSVSTIEENEKQVSRSVTESEKREEPERKLSVHEEKGEKPSGTGALPDAKSVSEETLNILPSPKGPEEINPDLEAEVFSFLSQYIGAYEEGDIARFIGFFSKYAMENNSLRYSDIRQFYAKNFEGNRYSYTLENVLIEKRGYAIIVWGDYSIKKIADSDKATEAHGTIQWTLTREEGTLKVLRIDYERK